MKHADIFDLVSNTEGLEPLGQWNQNLLTTTYEWNRKLKDRGQKADGIEISVKQQKPLPFPINILYNAWIDAGEEVNGSGKKDPYPESNGKQISKNNLE